MSSLARTLGPVQLIAAGTGCMVGAGIFLTTSSLARQFGAPSLLAGYFVAGLGCALTALCYAEFATLEPGAGSAYSYARTALGRFPAWLIGCALFLEYSFGSAAVATLWTGDRVYAALTSLGVAGLIALGIRISSGVNAALVALKCGTLILFLVWIAFWWTGHREAASAAMSAPANGWRAVAGLAVFSYLGFESVSTLGLESRDARRDLPIGVLGSLALTTLLYLAVIFAYCLVPTPEGEGLLGAARATGAGPLGELISVCVYLGLSTVLLVMTLGQSRIYYAMAKDGFLPRGLATVDPRTFTPRAAVILTGGVIALLCLTVPPQTLYNLAVTGTLLAFTAVAAAVPLLRIRRPDLPRGFRVPLVWLTAPAAVLVNAVLMSKLLPEVAWELAAAGIAACAGWFYVRKSASV